jgi:CRP-like cAMP-binding protein
MTLVPIPVDQFSFNNNSIFEGLTKEESDLLNSRLVTLKFKQGQMIFQEGGFPSGIHIVREGKVKKFKTGIDGKEQIFYICKAGEVLGYHALLSEENYSDSASAMEDSSISFIPKEDFLKVLKSSTILSNHLLKNLSHEFGVLINSITIMAHRSVRERLALSLLVLKDKYKENFIEGAVHITLSRDDLANFVGTAKETLVRLLHDFKKEGLIKTEGKAIIILNAVALVKVANYH